MRDKIARSHRSLLAASCLFCTFGALSAEPRVTYVGEGRYTCSGSAAKCAQIDQNNRQQQQLESIRNQQEQDRAQAYVDRERRKEDERRRNNN